MAPNLTVYCLEQLTDYADFERLCHDLMALEGYSSIEPLGGFKDKGRDAIHVNESGKTTIFAYSVREDWQAKLAEDTGKISKHGHTCNKVVFITTVQPTATERDNWIANVRNQYGWELEIYGTERLRVLLDTKYPEIKKKHPSIFPPEFLAAQARIEKRSEREHLFISYSPEDRLIADWLARKLTVEGYRVWCEHVCFNNEDKFPIDVHKAIQEKTFRVIAIYSNAALNNPDVVLQRNIAIGVGKERDEDFLISLNVNEIQEEKLDRITRCLKFISFKENWAEGLKQLLLKLDALNCPKPLFDGKRVVAASFFEEDTLLDSSEPVFSNYLKIENIPKVIYRFKANRILTNEEVEGFRCEWSCRKVDSIFLLAFHQPPDSIANQLQLSDAGRVLWQQVRRINGICSVDLVSELLQKSLLVKCFQKGLLYCDESKLQYFPKDLLKGNRLNYVKPNGSKSYVQVCNSRTYRKGAKSEKYQYYLAPTFSINRNLFANFAVLIRIRIRFSYLEGKPLKKRLVNSRRKHLCQNWWNDDWLNRIMAICQFFADEEKIIIGEMEEEKIVISTKLLQTMLPVSINEDIIAQFKKDRAELLAMLDNDDEVTGNDEDD